MTGSTRSSTRRKSEFVRADLTQRSGCSGGWLAASRYILHEEHSDCSRYPRSGRPRQRECVRANCSAGWLPVQSDATATAASAGTQNPGSGDTETGRASVLQLCACAASVIQRQGDDLSAGGRRGRIRACRPRCLFARLRQQQVNTSSDIARDTREVNRAGFRHRRSPSHRDR
jgi:hypothetical protein